MQKPFSIFPITPLKVQLETSMLHF